jgi:hypothetical protein
VGTGFPRYVTMSLASDFSAPGGHCLRADLNGGAAAAFGPVLEASADYTYLVTASIRSQGLRCGRAYISWRWVDADGQPVVERASVRIAGDTAWRVLRLVAETIDDPRVRYATVGFHVEPGEESDLTGSVFLADVRVIRQPRLRVTTGQPANIIAAAPIRARSPATRAVPSRSSWPRRGSCRRPRIRPKPPASHGRPSFLGRASIGCGQRW